MPSLFICGILTLISEVNNGSHRLSEGSFCIFHIPTPIGNLLKALLLSLVASLVTMGPNVWGTPGKVIQKPNKPGSYDGMRDFLTISTWLFKFPQ